MNAPGGKHPILYCTRRKNPEERRVSDGSAATDPDQKETRRCLQHGGEIGRHRELEALTSGVGGGGAGGASYYPEQETGGDSDVQTVKRNPLQATLMISRSAFLSSHQTVLHKLIHQTHCGVA